MVCRKPANKIRSKKSTQKNTHIRQTNRVDSIQSTFSLACFLFFFSLFRYLVKQRLFNKRCYHTGKKPELLFLFQYFPIHFLLCVWDKMKCVFVFPIGEKNSISWLDKFVCNSMVVIIASEMKSKTLTQTIFFLRASHYQFVCKTCFFTRRPVSTARANPDALQWKWYLYLVSALDANSARRW